MLWCSHVLRVCICIAHTSGSSLHPRLEKIAKVCFKGRAGFCSECISIVCENHNKGLCPIYVLGFDATAIKAGVAVISRLSCAWIVKVNDE